MLVHDGAHRRDWDRSLTIHWLSLEIGGDRSSSVDEPECECLDVAQRREDHAMAAHGLQAKLAVR
jgi:hypothetical protein